MREKQERMVVGVEGGGLGFMLAQRENSKSLRVKLYCSQFSLICLKAVKGQWKYAHIL